MHISSPISAPLQDKGVGADPVCPLSSQEMDGGAVLRHTAPIADISLHLCGISMPFYTESSSGHNPLYFSY